VRETRRAAPRRRVVPRTAARAMPRPRLAGRAQARARCAAISARPRPRATPRRPVQRARGAPDAARLSHAAPPPAPRAQVGSLVKARVFDRPQAVVVLNLAGVSPGAEALRGGRGGRPCVVQQCRGPVAVPIARCAPPLARLRLTTFTTPPPPPEDGTLDTLATALPDGASLRAAVLDAGAPARGADLISGLAAVAAANPDAAFEPLDESALGPCDASCMEAHLADAVQRLGGVLEPRGEAPSIQLPGGVALPLGAPGARLFADEVAALHAAARARLRARMDARRTRAAAGAAADEDNEQQAGQQQGVGRQAAAGGDDVVVYHATLVGLQAIRAAGGKGAEDTLSVAADALAGVLRELAAEVERAHGADVVYQITMLGAAGAGEKGEEGEGADAAERLAAWKREARRRLLDGAHAGRRGLGRWLASGLLRQPEPPGTPLTPRPTSSPNPSQ
jgi:hypothetical protein